MTRNRLEVWVPMNQDGIVLDGGGCDQRVNGGKPADRGTAQFNGFQTEPMVNRDDTLKQRQMILPLLLECLIALLGFQPCPEL